MAGISTFCLGPCAPRSHTFLEKSCTLRSFVIRIWRSLFGQLVVGTRLCTHELAFVAQSFCLIRFLAFRLRSVLLWAIDAGIRFCAYWLDPVASKFCSARLDIVDLWHVMPWLLLANL